MGLSGLLDELHALGLSSYLPIFFYIIGIIVIFLTLFYRVEIGIFFFAFILPWRTLINRMHNFPMGNDVLDVFIIVLLVKWMFKKRTSESKFIKNGLTLPIILMCLWMYIELWFGSHMFGLPNPTELGDVRIMKFKSLVCGFLLVFLVANNIRQPKHINYLIIIMVFSILVVCLKTYQWSFAARNAQNFSWGLTTNIWGPSSNFNKNGVALFLAMYSIIFLTLALSDKDTMRRVFFAFTALFGYFNILFTFSRGGYLASLVGLSCLALIKNRILFLILMILVIFYQSFLPNSVIQRIEMTRNEYGELDNSAMQRMELWQQSKQIILDNLIMGVGYGTAPYIGLEAHSSQEHTQKKGDPHNAYVRILLELGIIGLALYLWIFGIGIYSGLKLYYKSKNDFYKALGLGHVACILSIFTSNLFAGNAWIYFELFGYYWIIQGLIVRLLADTNYPKTSSQISNLDLDYRPIQKLSTRRAMSHPVAKKQV